MTNSWKIMIKSNILTIIIDMEKKGKKQRKIEDYFIKKRKWDKEIKEKKKRFALRENKNNRQIDRSIDRD